MGVADIQRLQSHAARWVAVWTGLLFAPLALAAVDAVRRGVKVDHFVGYGLPILSVICGFGLAFRVRTGEYIEGAFWFLTVIQGLCTSMFLLVFLLKHDARPPLLPTWFFVWNVALLGLYVGAILALRAVSKARKVEVSDVFE